MTMYFVPICITFFRQCFDSQEYFQVLSELFAMRAALQICIFCVDTVSKSNQNELLSIIEMLQFKDRVFKERLTAEQQRLVTSSQSSWRITSHFLILPQDGSFPRSDIVFGANDINYKVMASKIYIKYVKEESDYEINVDWATRNHLETLLDPERWEQDDEKEIEEIEPLNL